MVAILEVGLWRPSWDASMVAILGYGRGSHFEGVAMLGVES